MTYQSEVLIYTDGSGVSLLILYISVVLWIAVYVLGFSVLCIE